MKPVLVWDWPVRLFHIVLAVGFVGAYVIARFMGEDSPLFGLHMVAGLTIAAMVVLRLAWGFVGTRWARWSTLLHGPAAFADNLRHLTRRGGRHHTGHNPLSTVGIVAMLGLTLALAFTGYAYTQGNEAFEDLHPVLANLFLLVVLVHVAGVLLHQVVHGGRLVLGMVDGKKEAPESDAIPHAAPVAGLALAAIAAWIGGGMVALRDPAVGTTRIPGLPFVIQLGEAGEGAAGEGAEAGAGGEDRGRGRDGHEGREHGGGEHEEAGERD